MFYSWYTADIHMLREYTELCNRCEQIMSLNTCFIAILFTSPPVVFQASSGVKLVRSSQYYHGIYQSNFRHYQ